MNSTASPKSWLAEPPVKGGWALLGAIAAVGVATLIRASINGVVMGGDTIPYVPTVMLSAIFLGWRYAAVVALVSALVADALFIGPSQAHYLLLEGKSDIFGVSGFLATSALIIGFVEALRRALRDVVKEHRSQIVFSMRDGQAWASWYGHRSPVHLGTDSAVAETMDDFLTEMKLGKRFAGQSGGSAKTISVPSTVIQAVRGAAI
jgi:uncharacterized protein DUF4118